MPRLEELHAWVAGKRTAYAAYRVTLESDLRHHFALVDQIRRSAVSIPSNIAEGYGLGTRPQFIKGARIALGSAYELLTQLHLVKDLGLVPERCVEQALQQCRQSIALLIALLNSLGSNPRST